MVPMQQQIRLNISITWLIKFVKHTKGGLNIDCLQSQYLEIKDTDDSNAEYYCSKVV